MAMDNELNAPVLAEVLLRNPGGRSLAVGHEPVTAANVTQYYSPAAIQHAAIQRLQALGFDVVQYSPLGLTIRGNRALFERVFRTELTRAENDPAPTQTLDREPTRHTGGATASWEPAPMPY